MPLRPAPTIYRRIFGFDKSSIFIMLDRRSSMVFAWQGVVGLLEIL